MDYTPKGLYAKIEYAIFLAVMICIVLPFAKIYYFFKRNPKER